MRSFPALFALLCCSLVHHPVAAQDAVAQASGVEATASFSVSSFEFSYGLEHPDLPPADSFGALRVSLARKGGLVCSGAEGGEAYEFSPGTLAAPERFTAGALQAIGAAVVGELNKRGVSGVWVIPDTRQITPDTLEDQRPGAAGALRLVVWASQISEVRTVAKGTRIPVDAAINHPKHAMIAKSSPVQPGGLFRRDGVEGFLRGLSQHPTRRVEASVASAGEPGKLILDYLVNEVKPWQLIGQISNTGTASTGEWRSRVGFQHTQLTNHDDILSIDYVTAGEFDTNAIFSSYQFPLLKPRRLVARVYGSFGDFIASNVGFSDLRYSGDNWQAGGELAWRFDIGEASSLTASAGATFSHYTVQSDAGGIALSDGASDFLVPFIGLRFDRPGDWWSFSAATRLEHGLDGIANEDIVGGINQLGRTGAEPTWTLVRSSASLSGYLESLFQGSAAKSRAHEFTVGVRGQYAFDSARLIAQEQQLLGGAFTVRGYDESLIAADDAFIGSVEYAFHLPAALSQGPEGRLLGRPFRWRPPGALRRTDWDLIFRVFFDYGHRWVNPETVAGSQVTSSTGLADRSLDLYSVGGGSELRLWQNFSVRCDVGYVLNDVKDDVQTLAEVGDVRAHVIANISW